MSEQFKAQALYVALLAIRAVLFSPFRVITALRRRR